MKTSWHRVDFTPEQELQRQRATKGLTTEANLCGREGVEPPVILTSLFDVSADLITTQCGAEAVAPWFRAQADYADEQLGHGRAKRSKQAKPKTKRRRS